MRIIILQVGNMRNVAPYEDNPVMDTIASIEPFGTIILIIAAIVFLFIVFSFFGSVVPEMLGKKDVFHYVETRNTKKVEQQKQIQIKKEEKIEKERQDFRQRSNSLNFRAESEVLRRGYTEEKWIEKLKKDFERPPYSEFDEKTKELVWNALKDGWKDYNKKIKDDYLFLNRGDFLDLDNLFKFKK
jgi:hypothetical protein